MKKLKLLFALLLLPALMVQAQIQNDGRFLHDGILYRLNDETMTASVTQYSSLGSNEYTGDVIIPATITTEEGKTYDVDEIENYAFARAQITSFTCGENIKKLGSGVFRGCKQLKSATVNGTPQGFVTCSMTLGITLQNSWPGIGGQFEECTALESVTFGPMIHVIGDEAFANNTTLKEVHFSDSLEHIGMGAFQGCTALTHVNIPSSILCIGNRAFMGSGLTSISIHPSEKDWGEWPAWSGFAKNYWSEYTNEFYVNDPAYCHLGWEIFQDCASLAEVSLGDNVSLRGRCFKGTAWEAAQPDGVLYVDNITVGYKGELQPKIAIKEGTKRITGEPFWDSYVANQTWVEITLPQSLEVIDDFTFDRLRINTLTIPKNVKYVGPSALYECYASRIFMEPTTPPGGFGLYRDLSRAGWVSTKESVVFVPDESLDAYSNSPWSRDGVTIIPYDGYDAATDAVFTVNKELKTATITYMSGTDLVVPSTVSCNGETYTVTELNEGSIIAWGKLTLPETLTAIHSYAISFPQMVEGQEWVPGSVHIPASVMNIGTRAIIGAGIITVDAANTVYDNRDNCNAIIEKATNTLIVAGIENPHIPASVKAIGNLAFAENRRLTGIVLPEGLTSVGEAAFASCDSLTSLHIPASLTHIGRAAFSGCKWMSSITVAPENPVYESIDGFNGIIEKETKTLVQGCVLQPYTDEEGNIQYNKTLVIPDGIKRIGDMAYGFENIGIDYDVDYGSNMALQTIVLPPSCTTIGEFAFMACPNLKELIVRTREHLSTFSWQSHMLFAGSARENVTILIPKGTLGLYLMNGYSATNMIEAYKNESYVFNEADMTATLINSWMDEDGVFRVPQKAKGYYDNEEYTVTAVGPDDIKSTFSRNLKEVKKVELPATITRINYSAFRSCSALASINLPEGLRYIGESAFYGCPALASINLPEGLEYIGKTAFYGDTLLTDLTLPMSVTYVGSRAFYRVPIPLEEQDGISYFGHVVYAANRQEVQSTICFREGTTVVAEEQYTFRDADARRFKFNITFPKSMKVICDRAFYRLSVRLQANITSYAEVPPVVWQEGARSNAFDIDTLYVPAGCKEAYLTQGTFDSEGNFKCPWAAKTVVEMGGYKTDEGIHYALHADGTATLTAVDTAYHAALEIPETLTVDGKTYTVTAIGAYALDSCSVASISIPNTVEHIGQGAFQSCSIDEVVLPETGTEIAPLAFSGSDIQSIVLPEAITAIGDGAFRDCANLRHVVLPEGVTSIGAYAFSGMGLVRDANDSGEATAAPRRKSPAVNPEDELLAGKTFVTLPEGVSFIGDHAFDGVDVVESFISNPRNVAYGADFVYSGICRVPYGSKTSYENVLTQNGSRSWSGTIIERAPEVAIQDVTVEESADAFKGTGAEIFTLDGIRQSSLHRGMNIVRHADGKVSKIYVK